MATSADFVENLQSLSGLGSALTYKKMFGEYALYLSGKVVAFACHNQLYVKPTPQGRAVLKKVSEHPAYPGSKLYFRIDEELDDQEVLKRLLVTTADVLPPPKPKAGAKPKTAAKTANKAATKTAAKTVKRKPGRANTDR